MTLAARITLLAQAIANEIKTGVRPRLQPQGGLAGQVLTKTTGDDFVSAWATPGGGLTAAQVKAISFRQAVIFG